MSEVYQSKEIYWQGKDIFKYIYTVPTPLSRSNINRKASISGSKGFTQKKNATKIYLGLVEELGETSDEEIEKIVSEAIWKKYQRYF